MNSGMAESGMAETGGCPGPSQFGFPPPPHHLVLTAKKGRQTNLDAPIWLMSRAELINFKGFNVKSVA